MRWAKKNLFIIYSLIAMLFIAGCTNDAAVDPKKDTGEKPTQTEQKEKEAAFDGITTLLQVADKHFTEEDLFITPTEVYKKVVLEKDPSYQIVDVRDATSFGIGNIEGSINFPYKQTANLELINQLPKDKKLIVVCFSGHTASQTAAYWSLLGYDAVPMLNGMGGWINNESLGAPIQAEPFGLPVDTKEVKKGTFELPSLLVEDAKDLPDLLVKGTKAYFETENPAVKPAKVVYEEMIQKENDSVMIVDIRNNEHYQKGHLKGAINIPYTELFNEENLKALDPNKTIILIDYNGHVASQATRVLSILGYEAYPVKDGMRIWTNDKDVNGIDPISAEKIYDYPTTEINVDLESEAGPASCS